MPLLSSVPMVRIPIRLLVLSIAAIIGFVAWWMNQPMLGAEKDGPKSTSVELVIEAGKSTKAIAILASQVTGVNSYLLYAWFRGAGLTARIAGKNKPIRSGTYAINPDLTPLGLWHKLISGDEIMFPLTIPEGWTFAQMRAAINAAPNMQHTTTHLTGKEIMAALGKSGVLPEGRFFPDTYAYPKNASDWLIYRQAAANMDKHLQAAWNKRLENMPIKSQDELLILASIVEKETGKPSDRAEIAGVFINRLSAGMRLQTDPTVIYGMGERFAQQRGRIRRADLQRDTPYNTYTRVGLPPGPIALAGKASLEAAAQPKKTRALYFVARGDGSSQFSETLRQHNVAVTQFIKGAK